jgi:hypothetical protein
MVRSGQETEQDAGEFRELAMKEQSRAEMILLGSIGGERGRL